MSFLMRMNSLFFNFKIYRSTERITLPVQVNKAWTSIFLDLSSAEYFDGRNQTCFFIEIN